jgi:hypothetical protein
LLVAMTMASGWLARDVPPFDLAILAFPGRYCSGLSVLGGMSSSTFFGEVDPLSKPGPVALSAAMLVKEQVPALHPPGGVGMKPLARTAGFGSSDFCLLSSVFFLFGGVR